MAELPGTTDIHIPAAVKAKIDAGNAAFARLKAEMQAEQGGGEDGEGPIRPPVQEPPSEETQEPDQTQEPEHSEQPQVADTSEDREPTPAGDAELAKLQHAYRTLQGRYNAEVARAHRAVDEQSAAMARMQQQIVDLTAQIAVRPQAENKGLTPKSIQPSITEDEMRDYGPQFFDMIKRVAKEIADGEVEARLAELAPKFDSLTTQVADQSQAAKNAQTARFHAWMDTNASGWREQDDDPLFVDWLKERDFFSGVPRMKILGDAITNEEYPRVKLIFEGFAKERQAISPSQKTPVQTPTGRTRLGTMAAPNGGRGRTASIVDRSAPEAPLTRAEIAAYYSRKIRAPKSLSDAEVTAMERRIAATATTAAQGH